MWCVIEHTHIYICWYDKQAAKYYKRLPIVLTHKPLSKLIAFAKFPKKRYHFLLGPYRYPCFGKKEERKRKRKGKGEEMKRKGKGQKTGKKQESNRKKQEERKVRLFTYGSKQHFVDGSATKQWRFHQQFGSDLWGNTSFFTSFYWETRMVNYELVLGHSDMIELSIKLPAHIYCTQYIYIYYMCIYICICDIYIYV